MRVARVLMPRINKAGGRQSEIDLAVSALERGRSVDDMFSDAAMTPREAEEPAAIADDLLLPPAVTDMLKKLRG